MTDGCKQTIANHEHLAAVVRCGYPANSTHAGQWNARFERPDLHSTVRLNDEKKWKIHNFK
jgi:hypothetical protein